MSKCLVSGSFDPITNGHIDIIKRAVKMFDEVVVCVFNNEDKQYMFNLEERVRLCKIALNGMSNIEITGYSGMLFDFCKKNGITHIVRGFRNSADYAYETDMAKFNYMHCGVMTYLLPADKSVKEISSSVVRSYIESNNFEKLKDFVSDDVVIEIRRMKNA